MTATKVDGDLILVHGFWSSGAVWDQLCGTLESDDRYSNLRIHRFVYESPRWRRPWSRTRIPNYDDIAQTFPAFLNSVAAPDAPLAIVTHSQGGLILQRFLAWMLNEGRGWELKRLRLLVLLSCPNEGSEYLASVRAALGFNSHPQASDLRVLSTRVTEARRIVLRQIVNAVETSDRQCPIPFYVYSGRTDNVVSRESAQSAFPFAEALPGDHHTILETNAAWNLTGTTLKLLLARHLAEDDRPRLSANAERRPSSLT